MKKYFFFCFLFLTGLSINACKKEVKSTQIICLHDSSIDYLKRWEILTTQIDVFEENGTVKSHTVIYQNGYFQINSDYTYNLFPEDAPVNGKWNVNKNCEFVLNPNTKKERNFSVIELSDHSLTLRQIVGRTTITQRYKSFNCPDLASLQFRWDNAFTLQAPYSTDTVFKAIHSKQSGFFKLNTDASYNLVLGAITGTPTPRPVTGTWGIAQPGCRLVLDHHKSNEKTYEVQKLTTDSLVIWRKDTIAKKNFFQHYSKHK